MAVYYDQTFSYGGQTFSIRVDMRTSNRDDGDGRFTPMNQITVVNWDGTTSGPFDITDEEIDRETTKYQVTNEQNIDGVVAWPEIDTNLVTNKGYTRH
jgi:hypothetical protein